MKDYRRVFDQDIFSKPTYCSRCEGVLVYRGLGEYECEECGNREYDDYGKVRNYIEAHNGANVAVISEATGVTHKVIREMIKENRFAVIDNRGGYIRCEMCGANINSGRFCAKCEIEAHRQMEAQARERRVAEIKGGSTMNPGGATGSKRYTRER